MEENIIKHNYKIGIEDRRKANGHSSFLIFFTGLSGSGKSTIANALEQKLVEENIKTYTLDGDNVRKGINKDLSFSPEDRSENNRRIGEVANLFVDAGLVVLAAFVAPYEKDRNLIKKAVGEENYIEVFVNTSLEECERRDVKGLYKKARKGEIKDMTGISSPYEVPLHPDITLTEMESVKEAVNRIYELIRPKLQL
ncbi:adenylyl-sulfate kinase [Flagellimonas zhangzhouensis]|uniref:Adenylyl-sulfate kinase n=1 Tax=Flagellimonas zhangzhouensis TaxID=1073328 RepID=A0A1H2UT04_9FLAO|nr:adenylyl-sulfate kinase [Allomuricauda zhangzhouensis]SDQ14472.1 adenylylsulfate kinase [Allomuricauda zhangzhouensis]SDW58719.1 adenylylsulfate kinase [Allomuricauda zhangzhouensis]